MGQLISATLVMLLVFVANNGMQQTGAQGVTRPYVRPPARKNLELEFSLRQTSTSSATFPTQVRCNLEEFTGQPSLQEPRSSIQILKDNILILEVLFFLFLEFLTKKQNFGCCRFMCLWQGPTR
jgi:hypothetical protein